MAASSEHEFEGRVSGELSGNIRVTCVHILENPNDVTSSPKNRLGLDRLGSELKGILHCFFAYT